MKWGQVTPIYNMCICQWQGECIQLEFINLNQENASNYNQKQKKKNMNELKEKMETAAVRERSI